MTDQIEKDKKLNDKKLNDKLKEGQESGQTCCQKAAKKLGPSRLDLALVDRGLVPSREKAKTFIMAGQVLVDDILADKPGMKVKADQEIRLKGNPIPYVSRGGLKLEKAISAFKLDLRGTICSDMGASTGGFTDCMLQNGASKVYAIDVGYGQLDYGLRIDPRVVVMERTNIRTMDTALIEDGIDFISIDVSFISLNLILPVAEKVLNCTGRIVCLVKPQFEAGRDQVGKKGIVRDSRVHEQVIEKVIGYAKACGLVACGLTYSPVQGAKGNVEYLLYLKKEKQEAGEEEGPLPGKSSSEVDVTEGLIKDVVNDSHKEFI